MENGEEIPISYTFYLGKDMVQDFNIEANHAYSFNIAINAKGDWMTDSRIEEWKTVDFTSSKYPLANSYILNPIEWGTAKRTFRIPVQRAMTFWGKDGKADYENDEYLSFRQNGGKWIAFVLASDFEIDENNFCITKNKGNKDTDPYFEVKVAPGTKGNVIVAVGPDDDTQNISWSWHLWITDYDPYDALDWGDGTSGQYIYPVRNGAVHRYEGTYWNTYRNMYIMDRNLGFMSEKTLSCLAKSDVLFIESNHDEKMLLNNPKYSASLKTRILSNRGHLSNVACGKALVELVKSGVKQVVLSHLSEENNTPSLAYNTVKKVLANSGIIEGENVYVDVATQGKIGTLFEIKD